MNLTDGSRFEGEFSNDVNNGKGIEYCADGSIVKGIYEDGELIEVINDEQTENDDDVDDDNEK